MCPLPQSHRAHEAPLRASLLGRADSEGGLILGGGQSLDVEVRLSPQPIEMEPIVVEATRIAINIMLEDVERRAASGWGTVLLDEQLELRRSATRTTDILHEYGADILPNGRGLIFRRTRCGPEVYIDGIKVTHGSRAGDGAGAAEAAEALNMVMPTHIKAMEIYKGPAQTPGEFLGSNARCGVILIWTRRGG